MGFSNIFHHLFETLIKMLLSVDDYTNCVYNYYIFKRSVIFYLITTNN